MSDDDRDESAPVPSIPLTFKAGGKTISQKRMIQQPTPGEVGHFSNKRVRTCADCKFFDKNEKTDKFIAENQIFKKLKHDFSWKSMYLPTSKPGAIQELGLCGQSHGTRMVGPSSGACDQYRLKR